MLIDDSEGICAALDAAVQTAVDAFVDPWLEGNTPIHPLQFHTHAGTIAAEPIA